MGKIKDIKTISLIIAKSTAHKILKEYGNNPDTYNHLDGEDRGYRNTLTKVVARHNWNDADKLKIRQLAINRVPFELKEPHFNKINYPEEIIIPTLDVIMQEVMKQFS